jgi:hypothetical protein
MLTGTNAGSTAWLKNIYSFSRGALNIALFAFLVYVAFRNILNLNVETYGIKKILPKIIFAAFLGNLVMPLFGILSRIIDNLQVLTIFQPRVFDWISIVGAAPSVGGGIALVIAIIVALVVPGLAAIPIGLGLLMFLVFGLLLVVMLLISLFLALRPWIILLGVAVGPLAVACTILPETESIFKKWLKIVGFWMFYPLIIYAIRYVAMIIPNVFGGVDDGVVSSAIGFILPMIVKIILFATAVRAPFSWEKDVGGFVQALPQTVMKGAQTVDRANRAVYGGLGTRAYQSYRKRGTDAFNRGIKNNCPK